MCQDNYSGILLSVSHFIMNMVRKAFFNPGWVFLDTYVRVLLGPLSRIGLIMEIKHQCQDCGSHVGVYLLCGLSHKAKHTFVK